MSEGEMTAYSCINRILSSTGIPCQLSKGVREVTLSLKFPDGLSNTDLKASVAP